MFSITNKTMQIWLLSIGILFCGFVFPSTVQAAALTISGSLYSDEGSTPITSSKSIVVAVGTSTLSRHATTSDTSGNWTITIPTGHTIAAGIPLLIFVDGDAVDANLFTKASSSAANITNLHLYQNRVIVSHEGTSGTSTTVTDLSFYDSTDDTDVKYRAISNTLSVNKGTELHVLAGKTFAPGGTVTINGNASSGTDGSLHLGTGATYTAGGNTSVAGHFIASSTAVFTPGPHTLFLTATTSGKKIHAPTGTLGIVQVTGSSSVYTFQNAATTSSLTIWIRSALTAPASTLTVTGDLVVGGTFTHNNSTLVVASSSAQSFIGNFASSTLYDITLRGTGTKQFTPPYKFDETTSSTNIYSLVVDTTNGVLYAGSNNSGIIYRCALSTACDAAGDWTTSYDSAASTIYSLAVDTTNNVLYAGSGSGGIIYRCALSTACDAAGDWTTSYDSAASTIYSLAVDTTNNVLYAGSGSGGIIYRCALSTACDAGTDWTTSYDSAASTIYSLAVDTTNNVLYAGSGSGGIIYRCALSTACDAGTDWTTSYDSAASTINSLTIDTTNGVLYAGSGSGGIIYRCALSTACDAGTDWTTSYDSAASTIYSLVVDTTNSVLYAGSGSGGIIYRCALSTSCDAAGDWTTSYDSVSSNIRSLIIDTTNGVLYAGGQTTNFVYRCVTASGCIQNTATKLSAHSLTVESGGTLYSAASTTLTGNYTNNGTATPFDATQNTYLTLSGSGQTLSGNMTGASTLAYVTLAGSGTKTFSSNASTTALTVKSGATFGAPTAFSIAQTYENNGTLNAGSGTIHFPNIGSIASGTMTGTSAFHGLHTGGGVELWTISYDSADSGILSFVIDTTNGVLYAGSGNSSGIIYRCVLSTGCDAASDWTTSYDTPALYIQSLTIDTTNGVLYAGSGGGGIIYRCALSTSCDAAGDWTTSYDSAATAIPSLVVDTTNGVLYAGSDTGGIIYRCALSTACDAAGDWTTSYDSAATYIYSLVIDTTNGVLYAGSGYSAYVYRCVLSTGCDAAGDWTSPYINGAGSVLALTIDTTNGVLYAGGSTGGIIYRCAFSTGCDQYYDWSISYDTSSLSIESLTIDIINNVLYAGSYSSGIIYRCILSTSCDAAGDWTVSYDTDRTDIYSLIFDSVNDVLYAGTWSGGIIYRRGPGLLLLDNASTTDLSIGSSFVAPTQLSIAGDYDNQGTLLAGSGEVTFNGTTAQSLEGNMTDLSTFNDLIFTNSGTKTFSDDAVMNNFTVQTGATVVASVELTITGDYTNSGTVTASDSSFILAGDTIQTLSGTMTGSSAFADLRITNTSGLGSTSQSVIFANAASTTGTLAMYASTSVRFPASATSSFQNIILAGEEDQPIYLRSSALGTRYGFLVPGTVTVSNVDVRDSSACPYEIDVSDNSTITDSGNNLCWVFTLPAMVLSGSLFSDEGVTPITSGKTIAIAVSTSTLSLHSTTTAADGTWTVTVPQGHSIRAATPLLVWVDNDVNTRAALFTKAAAVSTSITDLDLYKNRVIISREGEIEPVNIKEMSFYDNTDDSDIRYAATSSPTTTLTVFAGNKLYIAPGKAFAPAGNVTVAGNGAGGIDGMLHVAAGATYYGGATTTIAGSLLASSTATIYPYGVLEFIATTTGRTITATSTALGDLVFNNTQPMTFVGNATTSDLTIKAGATVVAPADTLTITGSYTNSGTFTHNSGTTTFKNNGPLWTSRTPASSNSWNSVTYGNGLFVAVSYTGTGNRVITSPDGITWTSRTSAADNSWQSVTYGNGLFVAVSTTGTGNRVMTSPDGITWTSRTSAADNSWQSVTYGNGLFVAVSWDGTGNRVMTSPDGITWTSRTSAADNLWQSVTYGNGLFVAVSWGGTGNRVMTSPDGITWTGRTSAADNFWYSVTYGNGLFVAVSNTGTGNRVMTSPDGITWTSRTSAADNSWYSVTYGNGLFVAVSTSGTGNRVMTSPDGITWTSRTSAADNLWYSVTYGNGLFVAVAPSSVMTATATALVFDDGHQYIDGNATGTSAFHTLVADGVSTKVFNTNASTTNLSISDAGGVVIADTPHLSVSGDLQNNGLFITQAGSFWDKALDIGNNTQWLDVTHGGDTFVAVGKNGESQAMYSSDGQTWATTTVAGDNDWWYGVTYGDGIFVAVGNAGDDRVMYSTDGITWATTTAAGDDDSWQSVTYGNGLFVAVGHSGDRVMYSTDGITWATTTAAGDDDSWQSVTYGNGLFVAVGNAGDRVMYSTDGITWATTTAAGDDDSWQSVTYGNGLFVAVGNAGDRVMYSTDGITWATTTAAGDDDNWQSVTYGNGLFVAVSGSSVDNRVMTSLDGITWNVGIINININLFSQSVTYGNGLFVAVSSSDGLMYSSNNAALTFNGASAQSIGGSLTGASALGDVFFIGTGEKTIIDDTFTSNFTVATGTPVIAPAQLTVRGNYTNNGTTTHNGTLNIVGEGNRTISGYLSGASALSDLSIANIGTTTFAANASTTDLNIGASSIVIAPSTLSIAGDYTNAGTFTASTSEVVLNGISAQIATGTMTGANAFDDLTITNTSGNTTAPAITFGAPITTTGTFTMSANTSAAFAAGATSTFENVNWQGSDGNEVILRSTNEDEQWYLDIPGSQLNVEFVDVQDSNASSTDGLITAYGSIDSGNNNGWYFVPAGSSTIANHPATQVNNAFSFQNVTNGALFAFNLIPESGNATVTNLIVTISGAKRIDTTDFSSIRLYKDHNNNATYDATDEQVSTGTMTSTGQQGTITFATDFLSTTTTNYLVVANWNAPDNGSFLLLSLSQSGVTAVDENGTQDIYGSVDSIQHHRNNKGGGGASSAAVGGAAPAGDGDVSGGDVDGGGTIDENPNPGEEIGNHPDFHWPSAHSGYWTNAANAYDHTNGTYATTNTSNATTSYTNHGFNVPGSNQITGIEVKLEISGSTAAGTIGVQLSWDGGNTWTSTKTTATLTTSDKVVTLGGTSDTWGRAWSPANFSNANFAVRLTGNPSSNTVKVDALQVRVYHQATGGGAGGGGEI
jgi:hypothetical protein